jgi:HK97 family phage major capsid protein
MAAALKPELTLSSKERREYSIAAAITALAQPKVDRSSGLHFDIDAQIRKDWPERATHGDLSLMVPYGAVPAKRAGLYTGSASVGGDLVFTEDFPWIDYLRVQSVVLQAGATFLPGLKGNIGIPYVASVETIYAVAENAGSDTTQSDITFGQIPLTPNELQGVTAYSRQLLAQSALIPGNRIDRLVYKSIARQHAVSIDAGAIGGSGSSNNPTGVATQLAGAQLIAFGTNGAIPTWANLVAIEAAVANANAAYPEWNGAGGEDDTFPTSAWVISPTMRQELRLVDRGGATTTGRFLLESDRMFSTYPVIVSNTVPQALTKGSASGTCQAIIFGVWEDLIIGLWGPGFEIVVDPYTLKKQGMIELASYELYGVAVKHIGSFAGSLDALT